MSRRGEVLIAILNDRLDFDAVRNQHWYRIPISSQENRRRRIVFIPTTLEQFSRAKEINDLYNESSLENRLWDELLRLKVPAERQEPIRLKVPVETGKTTQLHYRDYFLDFAIYCEKGKIIVKSH